MKLIFATKNACFQVTCVALDKSEAACKLTSVNAARYNLNDRLRVIQGNISDGNFSIIWICYHSLTVYNMITLSFLY